MTTETPKSIGENTNRGYNMQIISGKPFYPTAPRTEEVEIEDIAHALSMLCRFGGHCKEFYSVAQHSVLVSMQVPPEQGLAALLHDASEAYIGDCVRPLKYQLKDFCIYEDQLQLIINDKFGVDTYTREIKEADNRMVWTEKRDLLNPSINVDWGPEIEPYADEIVPWSQKAAKRVFLETFELWSSIRD